MHNDKSARVNNEVARGVGDLGCDGIAWRGGRETQVVAVEPIDFTVQLQLACSGVVVVCVTEMRKSRDETGLRTKILVSVSVQVSEPNVAARSQGQVPDLQNICRFILRLS